MNGQKQELSFLGAFRRKTQFVHLQSFTLYLKICLFVFKKKYVKSLYYPKSYVPLHC